MASVTYHNRTWVNNHWMCCGSTLLQKICDCSLEWWMVNCGWCFSNHSLKIYIILLIIPILKIYVKHLSPMVDKIIFTKNNCIKRPKSYHLICEISDCALIFYFDLWVIFTFVLPHLHSMNRWKNSVTLIVSIYSINILLGVCANQYLCEGSP